MPKSNRATDDGRYLWLQRTMTDARGHEVVYVSHCLLNQNTRYLGGATDLGVVPNAILPLVDAGVGIVQMPCPEQRVWGGVSKRRLLWLLLHPRVAKRALPLLPLVKRYIQWRYVRIARDVARTVADYTSSGYRVRALVGVAGSPSCGVQTTLDLQHAVSSMSERGEEQPASVEWFNSDVVEPAVCPGSGMFVRCLALELARRNQDVPFQEECLPSAGDVAPDKDAKRAQEQHPDRGKRDGDGQPRDSVPDRIVTDVLKER